MGNTGTTIRRLVLHPTRQQPLVWLGRVAIFEHYNPAKLIRDVPLHRGLNIVWGKEEENGNQDVEVDGHGVGKTTFCRLIRYCLGEKHFARPSTRERIRWTFPSGYIAADVYVDGQRWSIGRPIGNSRLSFAQKDTTIEALLDSRPQGTYDGFRKAIDDVTLRELVVGATVGTNEPIMWDHFLAWCSRDQECRFQSLWEWRSTRSGSETPQFKKPKVNSIWMLRAVLKLLRDEEIKIEERLFTLADSIQKFEKEIDERKREPEYWRRYYRQRLVRQYSIADAMTATVAEDSTLFNLPALVRVKRGELMESAETQAGQLGQIDRDLAALAAQLGELEQLLDQDAATADVKSASSEALSSVSVETRQFLDELRRKAAFTRCRYGDVMLNDCSYVQNVLTNDADRSRISPVNLRTIAQNDQISAAARQREERWQQMVDAIKAKQKTLLNDRRTLEDGRTGLLTQVQGLDDSLGQLRTWESYFTKDVPDPELVKLQSDLGAAEHEQADLNAKLTELLTAQTEQRTELMRVYDGTVKSVLSAAYEGRLDLANEEMLFTFAKGNDIGGEALDTLAVLLADASAMLLAAEGRCLHPGILVHDSPREADLGSRIYGSLLGFFRELHEGLGGDSNAPFQYILTTTTPPPVAVQATNVVLSLSAANSNELLFRRELVNQEPTPTSDDTLY
jgi:hypothetical protein